MPFITMEGLCGVDKVRKTAFTVSWSRLLPEEDKQVTAMASYLHLNWVHLCTLFCACIVFLHKIGSHKFDKSHVEQRERHFIKAKVSPTLWLELAVVWQVRLETLEKLCWNSSRVKYIKRVQLSDSKVHCFSASALISHLGVKYKKILQTKQQVMVVLVWSTFWPKWLCRESICEKSNGLCCCECASMSAPLYSIEHTGLLKTCTLQESVVCCLDAAQSVVLVYK